MLLARTNIKAPEIPGKIIAQIAIAPANKQKPAVMNFQKPMGFNVVI